MEREHNPTAVDVDMETLMFNSDEESYVLTCSFAVAISPSSEN